MPPLPHLATIRQTVPTAPLADVAQAVRDQLTRIDLRARIKPGARIAVGAGSRGITDYALIVDTSAGNVTITLPPAASSSGTILVFKKSSASNTVTIQANASETIDGANTQTITAQYGSLRIICDGTKWWII